MKSKIEKYQRVVWSGEATKTRRIVREMPASTILVVLRAYVIDCF